MKESLRCIVVDDEHNAREVIKRYVAAVDWLTFEGEFKDPVKALNFVQTSPVDLVFLDINMPSLSGVDFIKALSVKPEIIFTTAYSEFALEGYENDVRDYLLKPIRFERFLKALSKVRRPDGRKADLTDFIMVRSGHDLHKIKIDEILYLQKDSNYIEIHRLKAPKLLMRQNMNAVFDIFPSAHFIRVHKSFVVSKAHISVIESHQIILSTHQKIPIGASYREELIHHFPA